MFFDNLIIPMRAQPFHFGHMHLLRTMSKLCRSAVVILCRDYGDENNPFSLQVRRRWIGDFLNEEKISNLIVPERPGRNITRKVEYLQYFDNVSDISDIVVLTTSENDSIYASEGFYTCNHHSENFISAIWQNFSVNGPIKLASTGRIIRQRLRQNKSCADYLSQNIESEARAITDKC